MIDFGFGSTPSGQALADRLAGSTPPVDGSGGVASQSAGQSDLPAAAAATLPPAVFQLALPDRVRIVDSLRGIEQAVDRFITDLEPFLERIRLIDEPRRGESVAA